jgi:hypothetical protein
MSDTKKIFDTEAGFRAAIDLTLTSAQREIRVFDRDLAHMGLSDRMHAELLINFLKGGRSRRLRIVVHDTDWIERNAPRLLSLLRLHSYAIEVRRTPEHLRELTDCWMLADEASGAIRYHADHARGELIAHSPADVQAWWQRFDELWEASEPCSPGSVTGL